MDSNNIDQNRQINNQIPPYQQPVYQQPVYQQPVYQQPVEVPITVGEWFLTMLLTYIPLVNIILLFVWAFGNNPQKSKANWAKARLIWMAIGIVMTIIFYSLFGYAIYSVLNY